MDRFTQEQIARGMFSDDQVSYMRDLAATPPWKKCASGWHFKSDPAGCQCGSGPEPSSELTCYQCGTAEPMADKLGWLELRFSTTPDWQRRFCGSICLNTWSNKATERLTRAILGTEPSESWVP